MTDYTEVQYPLSMQAGNSFTRIFRFKDGNGDPVDLTGYKAKVDIRRNVAADVVIRLDSEQPTENGSTLSVSGNEVEMYIAPEETVDFVKLPIGLMAMWDLRLIDADGHTWTYFPKSRFTINSVSTRDEG